MAAREVTTLHAPEPQNRRGQTSAQQRRATGKGSRAGICGRPRRLHEVAARHRAHARDEFMRLCQGPSPHLAVKKRTGQAATRRLSAVHMRAARLDPDECAAALVLPNVALTAACTAVLSMGFRRSPVVYDEMIMPADSLRSFGAESTLLHGPPFAQSANRKAIPLGGQSPNKRASIGNRSCGLQLRHLSTRRGSALWMRLQHVAYVHRQALHELPKYADRGITNRALNLRDVGSVYTRSQRERLLRHAGALSSVAKARRQVSTNRNQSTLHGP